MMTLDEALHYIHAVCWKGSIPGLERITALLDAMGHPERLHLRHAGLDLPGRGL
mgnify:CR=1 FL=1